MPKNKSQRRTPLSRQKITLSTAGNILVGGRRVSPSQLGGIVTARKRRGDPVLVSLPRNGGTVEYKRGTLSKRPDRRALFLTNIGYDGRHVSERFGFVQYRYEIPEPTIAFISAAIEDADNRSTKPVTVFYGVVDFENESGDDVAESTKTYGTYLADAADEMAERLERIIDVPRSNQAVVTVHKIQLRFMQDR